MTSEPVYYNEHDLYAAKWLENLIAAGHVAPGIVDRRSIADVRPSDLAGFAQCHFFAGIGIWSYALRRAGWADSRHVWTASCPCQPFSEAGQGAGFADDRHLWPFLQWLIAERKPARILGEQVAGKDAEPWFDLVATDLEGMGYACGAVPFSAAGIGAPNIRDRLYWLAHAEHGRCAVRQPERARAGAAMPSSFVGGLVNATGTRLEGRQLGGQRTFPQLPPLERNGSSSGVADNGRPGPVNGYWRNADWLFCRDGQWRPVEPRTFPLAAGDSSRVGRLRAYGNALNAQAAIEFVSAAMGCLPA